MNQPTGGRGDARAAELKAEERRLTDARQYKMQLSELQNELRLERLQRDAQAQSLAGRQVGSGAGPPPLPKDSAPSAPPGVSEGAASAAASLRSTMAAPEAALRSLRCEGGGKAGRCRWRDGRKVPVAGRQEGAGGGKAGRCRWREGRPAQAEAAPL